MEGKRGGQKSEGKGEKSKAKSKNSSCPRMPLSTACFKCRKRAKLSKLSKLKDG